MPNWSSSPKCNLSCNSAQDIVGTLLESRGVSQDDLNFKNASLSDLSDPNTLGEGADSAASLLISCKGRRAAVIGDYDADGIISSALVKKTVEILGGTCDVFLPSRWKHGYGLNDKTISSFIDKHKYSIPDVLFILDCGSSSESYVVALKNFGIKHIAVIDHHIPDATKMVQSVDAHVNWRIFGTAKNLCAAGEAFQVCRLAMMKTGRPWKWMLPLAAVATVGDVVPVEGDNRIIIRNGADYNMMLASESPGLVSLVMKQCVGGVSQKNLAFYVVPRINAVGRISAPDFALQFLLEPNPDVASMMMMKIDSINDERKIIQEAILRDGIQMLGGQKSKPSSVFLHNPIWNIGICGISCSQMVQKFGVPVMMFGSYGDRIRGSGRSIPGVNIKNILDECGEEVFERWGGHEMACGATVRGGMFNEASRRFGAAIAKLGVVSQVRHTMPFDADILASSVTSDLGDTLLETIYPYCPLSNPEPVFRIQNVSVLNVKKSRFKSMTRMSIIVKKDGTAIPYPLASFIRHGVDDDKLETQDGDVVDIYFSFPQTTGSTGDFDDGSYNLELVDIKGTK